MSTEKQEGLIALTRGECLAIALVLQTREKRGAPEIEAALARAEEKLRPLAKEAFDKAFGDLFKGTTT